MAGLQEKADKRTLGEKRKPVKIIIADPMASTSSFVQETTINLDSKVKNRGQGEKGTTIGAAQPVKRSSGSGVTSGMGGRHN